MIDDCLPDALIYEGASRETMQLRMREAVLQVLSNARADAPLVVVTHSMGSKLLSYTLPPERYAAQGVTVYNIIVSNAPSYLGLLERPDLAHLDYLSNPDVGRLIACGQPTSKLCK